MHFTHFHRNTFCRVLFIVLFGFILVNEFLLHYIRSIFWPDIKCGEIENVHTIMLVADPQILGEQTEHWIARWDNDRYLKNSFHFALQHVQPDLIIFLGDLMDEGSISKDDEYQRYFYRFKEIFQLDYIDKNKTIFVPGDNDIGGEDELVTKEKVDRFNKFFPSPIECKLGNMHIIQVNKMQRYVPYVHQQNNTTRIVVSHMPVLGLPSVFAAEVLEKIRPHLVLSAHDHTSVHFSADLVTGDRTLVEGLMKNEFAEKQAPSWRFQGSDRTVNEVVVPTCSYRMGVAEMGFGVAVIDKRGEAWCYHMLWLPSRFKVVAINILVIVTISIGLFHRYCCTFRSRCGFRMGR